MKEFFGISSELAELYLWRTVRMEWGGGVDVEIPRTGFSSAHVDRGTSCLLREVQREDCRWGRVLDVGCGYGPIGLFLRASGRAESVVGLDRDALGVHFSVRNAARNRLAGCEFRGGLAYEDVPGSGYDAVLCNVPAKAGQSVHRLLLGGVGNVLAAGGVMWVVVVTPLEAAVDELLAGLGATEIRKRRQGEHIVYGYRPAPGMVCGWEAYVRHRALFEWCGFRYELDTACGLPEYDEFSRETVLLGRAVEDLAGEVDCRRVVVCEPGPGHVGVICGSAMRGLEEMVLVSRDALVLDAGLRNMGALHPGVRVRCLHTAGLWPEGAGLEADAVVVVTIEKEGAEVNAWKLAQVCKSAPGARVLALCTTSLGGQLQKLLAGHGVRGWTVKKRKRLCVVRCAVR